MKRILTLLAFMALTITANAVIQSGTCGENVTFVLNDDGTLVITGSGEMSSSPWLENRDKINKAQIEDGVTNIGDYAFYQCSSLTSITIGNSVTSIGGMAFYQCSSLTSVTIPNSVTSIGDHAFEGCSSLTSITIPNSVTSIENYTFSRCSALTSITIGNSVTSIGNEVFFNCSSLNSVTIPNSVTSIGCNPFSGCSGLTSIKVEKGSPNYDSRDNCNAIIDTSTNTLISGCKTTIIPNSVTSIGARAFYKCTVLTSVTIPNSVTSIGDEVFIYCSSLTSITIGNSVTSIGGMAFYDCSKLKEMHSQAIKPPYASSGAFSYVSKDDCKLYVPIGSKEAYASASGWREFIRIIEGDDDVEALKAQVASLQAKNSALESEITTLKETIMMYAKGDLNLDGRTNIDDVVYLLKLDSYSSDTDALALLLDGSTAITLSEITDKYGDVEFYTLNGVKVDIPNQTGIYIVKKNGETKMIVVKK